MVRRMKKLRFPIVFAILAVCLAVIVCLSAILTGTEVFAAETSEETFEFSLSHITVAATESEAAVYFHDLAEISEVTPVFYYSDGTAVLHESKGAYFTRKPEYEGKGTLQLRFERGGEIIFEYGAVTANAEEGKVLSELPIGQKFTYDGTEHLFTGAVFTDTLGTETKLLNAGEYLAKMEYGGTLGTVNIPFKVEKGKVTVEPEKVTVKYGEIKEPTVVKVIGKITDEEREYVKSNSKLELSGVTDKSLPGNYDIMLTYTGEPSENYDLTVNNGKYVIEKADFDGFTFTDKEYLYDGKPHYLTVEYDAEKWANATVTYSVGSVTEVGKYLCEATVKMDNYNELVLTAYLTIKSDTMASNNLADTVTLQRADGFDPEWTAAVVKNENAEIAAKAEKLLTESSSEKDVIKGIYDVKISDGENSFILNGEMKIKLKIDKVPAADGIKLYLYDGENLTEAKYEIIDGCYVFTAGSTEGFVFIGKEKVKSDVLTVVLYCAVFGVGILIVLIVVFDGFNRKRKDKNRWRKKHNRWA